MKTRLRTLSLFILIFFLMFSGDALATTKQKIYDYAELLTAEEVEDLERLATAYSDETEVDIIILTTNETDGRAVEDYMGDFYDEEGLGYNKQHGDTVILTLDMGQREVYVAGFYKGELYIDNSRAELIREEIMPNLSEGYYFEAFTEFIEQTRYYLGIEPEFDDEPNQDQYYIDTRDYRSQEDNIFFELWFQLLISAGVGGIAVGIMGYRSSGRKTTNARTYLDDGRSAVTARNDTFIRKTVTKVKKPTSNKGGGGGIGGGGFTGGGHSHSGSKGKF
jgi:uncharacterized protein